MTADRFIAEHSGLLESMVRAYGAGLPHMEDDLRSAAYLGVVEGLQSYDADLGPMVPHVFDRVRTRLRTLSRHEGKAAQRNASLELAMDAGFDAEDIGAVQPDEALHQGAVERRLLRLVRKLPTAELRAVAKMRLLADPPVKMECVASTMGVTLSHVKHLQATASRMMRERYLKEEEE